MNILYKISLVKINYLRYVSNQIYFLFKRVVSICYTCIICSINDTEFVKENVLQFVYIPQRNNKDILVPGVFVLSWWDQIDYQVQ